MGEPKTLSELWDYLSKLGFEHRRTMIYARMEELGWEIDTNPITPEDIKELLKWKKSTLTK